MSSFYQSVISIISKPQDKRNAEEIHLILAWFVNLFKKKSSVFGDIDAEVVRDIIKNCSFETKKPDDIIIRQGAIGDCFYINLRGRVSIYLNHKKHDDSDNLDNDLNASFSTSSTDNEAPCELIDQSEFSFPLDSSANPLDRSKKIRERLGNFVTSLGAGEGFGEIALVSEDTRTASIIADEETDLMVVNKALYARCLQSPALRKLQEKQDFINNSPFFGTWAPKMKKLLSLCLERDVVPYDSYLHKQGEPADKIYFLVGGSATVTVNSLAHPQQYPRLYPLKLPENAEKEIISSWIDEKNSILSACKHSPAALNPRPSTCKTPRNSQAIQRRNETFAEAEHRLKTRNTEVGIIGPGEVTGLAEIIFDLPSCMHSIRCIEDCDVFYIYKRSYERLICKRNPACISKMKDYVYMKLLSRNNRLKTKTPVDLYRSLQYRIELGKKKRSLIPVKINRTSTTATSTSNTPLDILKGPIIQLDAKPKLEMYQRLKRRNTLSKQELPVNRDAWITENISKLIQPDLSVGEAGNQEGSGCKYTADGGDSALGSYDSCHETESRELDHLEGRIKRWHLEVGCKKACVPKLNRIDLDKIKTDIKVGGNIFIRKSVSDKPSRLRTRSGFSEDSEDSGSDQNNWENEAEFASTSIKILNALRLNTPGDSSLVDQVQKSLSSSFNLMAPLNANETRNMFIDNFLAYISSDSNNESSDSIDRQIHNEKLLTPDHAPGGSYLNYQSIQKHNKKMRRDSQLSCEHNNTMSQISSLAHNFTESIENLNFNAKTVRLHRESVGGSMARKRHDSVLESSQEQLNVTKETVNCADFESVTETTSRQKGGSKKRSLPNIVFRSHRQSVEMAPIVNKKKFSLGSVKVQKTGKKYTKEEYEVLKAELKKQSQRFNKFSSRI